MKKKSTLSSLIPRAITKVNEFLVYIGVKREAPPRPDLGLGKAFKSMKDVLDAQDEREEVRGESLAQQPGEAIEPHPSDLDLGEERGYHEGSEVEEDEVDEGSGVQEYEESPRVGDESGYHKGSEVEEDESVIIPEDEEEEEDYEEEEEDYYEDEPEEVQPRRYLRKVGIVAGVAALGLAALLIAGKKAPDKNYKSKPKTNQKQDEILAAANRVENPLPVPQPKPEEKQEGLIIPEDKSEEKQEENPPYELDSMIGPIPIPQPVPAERREADKKARELAQAQAAQKIKDLYQGVSEIFSAYSTKVRTGIEQYSTEMAKKEKEKPVEQPKKTPVKPEKEPVPADPVDQAVDRYIENTKRLAKTTLEKSDGYRANYEQVIDRYNTETNKTRSQLQERMRNFLHPKSDEDKRQEKLEDKLAPEPGI